MSELCGLELGLSLPRVGLGADITDHDSGQWVDPNALAGAVADVHNAALALETRLALTTPDTDTGDSGDGGECESCGDVDA